MLDCVYEKNDKDNCVLSPGQMTEDKMNCLQMIKLPDNEDCTGPKEEV